MAATGSGTSVPYTYHEPPIHPPSHLYLLPSFTPSIHPGIHPLTNLPTNKFTYRCSTQLTRTVSLAPLLPILCRRRRHLRQQQALVGLSPCIMMDLLQESLGNIDPTNHSSIHPPIQSSIQPSTHPSIYPSNYPPIQPYIRLKHSPFILSTQAINPSILPFIYPPPPPHRTQESILPLQHPCLQPAAVVRASSP